MSCVGFFLFVLLPVLVPYTSCRAGVGKAAQKANSSPLRVASFSLARNDLACASQESLVGERAAGLIQTLTGHLQPVPVRCHMAWDDLLA